MKENTGKLRDYTKLNGLEKVNKKDSPSLNGLSSYIATDRVHLEASDKKSYFVNAGDVIVPLDDSFVILPKDEVTAIESILSYAIKKNTPSVKKSEVDQGVVRV